MPSLLRKPSAAILIMSLSLFVLIWSSLCQAANGCGRGYHRNGWGNCKVNHPGPWAQPAYNHPGCWRNRYGNLRCEPY